MTAIEFDRLEMVFETAARKKGRDRADFIERLGTRNPDLANEVRTLLRFHSREADPLEAACDERRATTIAHQDGVKTPLPTIPGYVVQRRIGSGGQADVFLAQQESTGQDVAVKVFRGYSLADSQRNRIDAEAKALVRLQLPNVVAILDRGQTVCGREYLVTRFVDGLPIDEAASKLLVQDCQGVVDLFAKVAETLSRVHQHGIIHRDLKPSNILVDKNGEPYLLDFGLASFFADPSGRLLTATPESAFQGSILWASPEQVDASFGSVDHRSDIYSLGVVLYQSLTGRFPYPVDGGILDVAQQIVRTEPAGLTASSGGPKPNCARGLETVVLRALDKQPQRRFQSADNFAAALRSLRNAVPTDPHITRGNNRRSRLSRLVLFAGAVAAVVVLWPGLNAALVSQLDERNPDASADSGNASDKPNGPNPRKTATGRTSRVASFDDELAAFGVVPPRWSQVGKLQNNYHQIERADVSIEGDFTLALHASADPTKRAEFALTLVGTNGGNDVSIFGQKINTWSDNESWEIRTPSGTVLKGLPVGSHTFTLKRQGELITLDADAVHQPNQSSTVFSTFAANGSNSFKAIRLSTTPGIRLGRLRLHTAEGAL